MVTDIHVRNTSGTPGTWHRPLHPPRHPQARSSGQPRAARHTVPALGLPAREPGGAITTNQGKLSSGVCLTLDPRTHGTPPIPDGATGVIATVAVVETGSSGHLDLYAFPGQSQRSATINWDHANQSVTATVPVRLGPDGITLAARGTATHAIIDITGWITVRADPPSDGAPGYGGAGTVRSTRRTHVSSSASSSSRRPMRASPGSAAVTSVWSRPRVSCSRRGRP